MSTYPTTIDTLSNPASGDGLNSPSHADQHINANDAIEALEAKVGADSSAVTTSHDYKLSEVTDKAVGKTATQTLTNKTLTSPILNLSSNATGDMYYRASDGTLARLPIGTTGNILDVSAGGVPEWIPNPSGTDASTSQKGVVKLDTAPASATEPIAVGSNSPIFKKLIGVGVESNTLYETYKYYFGAATGQGWTTVAGCTYYGDKLVLTSAGAITRQLFSLDTMDSMDFNNTKNKILEWDAVIQADATTGTSLMGFWADATVAAIAAQDTSTPNKHIIGFLTSANGSWNLATANGTTNTRTVITTPSAGKHTFRMEINPTTPSVLFYIDGVLVGTHTTNIPTTASGGMYLTMGNGTSSVLLRALSAPTIAIQK